MDVELPSTGCNISNSSGYIDNYYNGIRTRYLLNENKAVKVYQTSYTGSNPTQYYTCLHTGDIIYKPELSIYFQVIAGGMIFLATAVIFHIIFERIIK